MNNLQIIKEQEVLGKEFRVYGTTENPLFLAKDVAEWIEYSEGNASHMCSLIDKDEVVKMFCSLPCSNICTKPVIATGSANRLFITEEGLYEVLFQSTKPIAKEFKKQVKVILKQIRQTGGYIHTNETMSDEEIMARALLVAQSAIQKKDELIKQQLQTIETIVTANITFNEFDKEVRTLINVVSNVKGWNYGNVWTSFYEYVNMKLSINLKLRQTNKIKQVQKQRVKDGLKEYTVSTLKQKYTMLKMVNESEFEQVLQIMKCWCVDLNIDITDYNKLTIKERI